MVELLNLIFFGLNCYFCVLYWRRADDQFEDKEKTAGWISVVISAVCGAAAATYVF